MNMQSEDTSQGTFITPSKYDQEASNKRGDKVKKRKKQIICIHINSPA